MSHLTQCAGLDNPAIDNPAIQAAEDVAYTLSCSKYPAVPVLAIDEGIWRVAANLFSVLAIPPQRASADESRVAEQDHFGQGSGVVEAGARLCSILARPNPFQNVAISLFPIANLDGGILSCDFLALIGSCSGSVRGPT